MKTWTNIFTSVKLYPAGIFETSKYEKSVNNSIFEKKQKNKWSCSCFVTLVLLNSDMSCLCKQCRFRSVDFWRSKLTWICTVCHSVFEFVSKLDQVNWFAENYKWAWHHNLFSLTQFNISTQNIWILLTILALKFVQGLFTADAAEWGIWSGSTLFAIYPAFFKTHHQVHFTTYWCVWKNAEVMLMC